MSPKQNRSSSSWIILILVFSVITILVLILTIISFIRVSDVYNNTAITPSVSHVPAFLTDASYTISFHENTFLLTFSSNGTIVFDSPCTLRYLVVGGGGAGGSNGGGGGGGGGVISGSITVNPGVPYPIMIGKGGAPDTKNPGSGGSSVFHGMTAYGGGAGGCRLETGTFPASKGGCGGGGSATDVDSQNEGGDPIQGYRGGNGYNGSKGSPQNTSAGGGGGGAGQAGADASDSMGGHGGNGYKWLSNEAVYGGGGGGGIVLVHSAQASGGSGGGGSGGGFDGDTALPATDGTDGLGGGGGGGGPLQIAPTGARGGSGTVILAVPLN